MSLKMETAKCRICLAQNIRMHSFGNTFLQEVYERFTKHPFVSVSAPLVACYICHAHLRNAYHLMNKCRKAEDAFKLLLNDDKEFNEDIDISYNLIITPMVLTSTDDDVEKLHQEDDIEDENIIPKLHEEDYVEEENIIIKSEDVDSLITYEFQPTSHIELDPNEIKEEPLEDENQHDVEAWTELDDISHSPEQEQSTENELVTKKKPIKQQKKKKARKSAPKKAKGTTKKRSMIKGSKANDVVTATRITNDVETHTGEKPYQCDTCSRGFLRRKNIIHHLTTHERPYKCDICQISYITKTELKHHTLTHLDGPYQCDVCQKILKSKDSLKGHYRLHKRWYVCSKCLRGFPSYSSLKLHMHSQPEKRFLCDKCPRSFEKKSKFLIHERIHTGERPHKCQVCNNAFRLLDTLKAHMLTHTGQKPYNCNLCGKCFRTQTQLAIHRVVHTGEKPYKCDICEKSFSQRCNMRTHKRLHMK